MFQILVQSSLIIRINMNIYGDLEIMFPQIAAEAGFSLFRMRFLPYAKNSSQMQFLAIEVSPLFLL